MTHAINDICQYLIMSIWVSKDTPGPQQLRDRVYNFQLRMSQAVLDFLETYVFKCRFEKFRKQSGLSFSKKCNPSILEGF